MKLGVSWSAAPELGAVDLIDACAARGMETVELSATTLSIEEAPELHDTAIAACVRIAGITASSFDSSAEDVLRLTSLARALHAPVIVEQGSIPRRVLLASSILASGGDACPVVACAADARMVVDAGLDYVWQADPARMNISADLAVMPSAPHSLRWIRFAGGGPESPLNDGRGVGTFMTHLALSGYRGALILTPSSQQYRVIWRTWLRRRGWGCGSAGDSTPVVLDTLTTAGVS
jgi:hypothetical protein